MTKYVLLSGGNQAAAFYDSVINAGAIPSGAVEISDSLWSQWIASPSTAVYNASTQTISVPPPSLASLQAMVVAASGVAANAVLAQIYPDPVHQSAAQNAAMMAAIAGGTPASSSPFYAQFNAFAGVYGITPAALAALATALTNQSLALSGALITLQAAAAAAANPSALAAALGAFETALGAVVTACNAASPPVALVAPAAISIAGVNA